MTSIFAKSVIGIYAALLALLAVPATGIAQSAPAPGEPKQLDAPSTSKHKIVPTLIVLSAHGATLNGSILTLQGVAPSVIVFADRPVRSAGHALTTHLLEEWKPGSGSFAKVPPNATVSVFSSATSLASNAVVVLTSPKLDGNNLAFNVRVIEGDLSGADGPASVFIDIIDLPISPLASAQSAIEF